MWTLRRVDEWGDYRSPFVCHGKSAPSPPPAPDPTTTANAQSAADINTAEATQGMNMVGQVTPYGNLAYNQTGSFTTPSGQSVPQYTADITLNPQQQQALNQQESLTNSLYSMANNQVPAVQNALSTPINASSLPALPTNPSGIDQNATNTVYQGETGLLQPQFQQQTESTQDQLLQEGLDPQTAAYQTAMGNVERNQNAELGQVADQAVSTGAQLGAQQFSQAQSANEAALQEQENLQLLPLNEAIALTSGTQINNPSFVTAPQTSVAPTDVLGAYGLQQSAQNTAYQGGLAQANSGNTAAAGLVGAAATAAAIY